MEDVPAKVSGGRSTTGRRRESGMVSPESRSPATKGQEKNHPLLPPGHIPSGKGEGCKWVRAQSPRAVAIGCDHNRREAAHPLSHRAVVVSPTNAKSPSKPFQNRSSRWTKNGKIATEPKWQNCD
ncbi:hypothetical protein Fot_57831 [Forsythia ovata]|uniref:Uncharacterized protein n=1 Tax=Forsythia ovata TaxID=205694 RepID=A0ABD1NTZ3_9LAMI